MKVLLVVALLVSTLAAAPSPAASSHPSVTVTPAATPAPRLDLRSATNPAKKREMADARDLKKHAIAANTLCFTHGFGALVAFRREPEEDAWLVLCNPKSGLARSLDDTPAILVDRL